MKTRKVIAAAAALVVAAALAACSGGGGGGGGNDDANCTNKITKTDAPVVTLWAWYPNMELVVDNFNKEHDDVQVCWTNAGAGGDEYDKFQTAITAGTGAPDVVMVEADRIAVYQIQDALVDISGLGYDDVKDNFSEGAWKDVSVGDGVYGAPIDGGPMAMIYRKDVFAAVRHHPSDHLGGIRDRRADGEGCGRAAVRRLRRERAGRHHGAAVSERCGTLHLRPRR